MCFKMFQTNFKTCSKELCCQISENHATSSTSAVVDGNTDQGPVRVNFGRLRYFSVSQTCPIKHPSHKTIILFKPVLNLVTVGIFSSMWFLSGLSIPGLINGLFVWHSFKRLGLGQSW